MLDEGKADPFKFDNIGDRISGKVTRISTRDNDWGVYTYIELLTKGGERYALHLFGAVLDNAAQSALRDGMTVGHDIGVKRLDDGFSEQFNKHYPDYLMVWDQADGPTPVSAGQRREQGKREQPAVTGSSADFDPGF